MLRASFALIVILMLAGCTGTQTTPFRNIPFRPALTLTMSRPRRMESFGTPRKQRGSWGSSIRRQARPITSRWVQVPRPTA
jgi:hypothetical protein